MRRLEPRISVNKLGEYMVANAFRRRTIRQDQEDSKTFKAGRYKEANRAILKYLADPDHDFGIIESALRSLHTKPTDGPFQEQERILNIDALESFADIIDQLDLRSFPRKLIYRSKETIEIGGVTVSVNPYILYSTNDRSGNAKLGTLKLHFPKGHPLDAESAPYVGAIMLEHCQVSHVAFGKPEPSLFRIVDVSTKKVFTAPKSTKKRLSEIEAACQEIASGWNGQ